MSIKSFKGPMSLTLITILLLSLIMVYIVQIINGYENPGAI